LLLFADNTLQNPCQFLKSVAENVKQGILGKFRILIFTINVKKLPFLTIFVKQNSANLSKIAIRRVKRPIVTRDAYTSPFSTPNFLQNP